MSHQNVTETRKKQLEAARRSLKDKGKSPREIGEENLKKILKWIYEWGFTTPEIANLLLNRTSGGYLQKLALKGWVVATKTKSGVPQHFYTLTEDGLSEAIKNSEEIYKYIELDPFRVNQANIRHDLTTQRLTINAINKKIIKGYLTERMFPNINQSNLKRPDAIWFSAHDECVAIEVELTAKWDRKLDEFISRVIESFNIFITKKNRIQFYYIFSDSQKIIERYENAFQPERKYYVWELQNKRYVKDSSAWRIPNWVANKVIFKLIK